MSCGMPCVEENRCEHCVLDEHNAAHRTHGGGERIECNAANPCGRPKCAYDYKRTVCSSCIDLWKVVAQVTDGDASKWVTMDQIPMFYVHASTAQVALDKAMMMLKVPGRLMVSIGVCLMDGSRYDSAVWRKPSVAV